VELVNTSEVTCETDYEGVRLPYDYVWISPFVHSNPGAHYWQPSAGVTSWNEIVPANPPAHFFNLFACSNCRFTTPRYMGGVYAFATDSGLAAVGSTTSGAMLWFIYFYGPLGGEASLGEAWRLWWDYIAADGLSQGELNWHIGMVLLGDPSLIPSKHLTGISGPDPGTPGMAVSVTPNPAPVGIVTAVIGVPAACLVTIEVYDMSGRLVYSGGSGEYSQGTHQVEVAIPGSGVYFLKVSSPGQSAVRRFAVLY
jgi:hypothetical protein